MCAEPPNPTDVRKRIETEDALLNTRTQIFLVLNGLLITALGAAGQSEPLKLLIALLGLVVCVPWVLCAHQSWKVIRDLTIAITSDPGPIERIVQNALFKPGWKRPTDLLARFLPRVFVAVWVIVCIPHTIFTIQELRDLRTEQDKRGATSFAGGNVATAVKAVVGEVERSSRHRTPNNKALDTDVAHFCTLQASFALFTDSDCSKSLSVGPPRGST